MKKLFYLFTCVAAVACNGVKTSWTEEELSLIDSPDQIMRVLTTKDVDDSLFLRKTCTEFEITDLTSDEYKLLADKMVATVTSPEQDGVGIAGPQVGIGRRIVAVLRYDKPGEVFEVFPNIRISEFRGEKQLGPEGCLSVPDCRGDVMRYQDITIEYTSPYTLQDTSEVVKGYTAVIFQHECDHLDGVLYTDRIE